MMSHQRDLRPAFRAHYRPLSAVLAITPSSSTEFLGRPSWLNERLRLQWDFYPTPEKFEPVRAFALETIQFCERFLPVKDVAIGRLSVMEQEAIIVEDLLLCMLVSIY
jgi:hypothetical protein